MRTIDADALERALGYLWVVTTTRDTDDKETSLERAAMCRGIDVCIGIVQRAPTVGGWISAEDGLPSRNKIYLITLKTPEGLPQVMEAYLDYGGTWWRGNVSLINEYVTHWQLLPEPPEVEG